MIELEKSIGYTFKNKDLLKVALTHSSYANEHQVECNERLEYLGDAVLDLCISCHLYENLHYDEGVLTKTRANAVREEALNVYAEKIKLNKYLYLGNGEIQNGGRNRPAIIADAFEAMLGAILLDSSFEEVFKVVKKIVLPSFDIVTQFKDYKSTFQEKVQADKRTLHYEIVKDEGPANDKTYEAVVYMDDILMGRGLEDTAYMDDEANSPDMMDQQEPPAPNSKANSAEAQKMLHLFSLSQKLYDFGVVLEENIENIDLSSIDINVVVELSRLKDKLANFLTKLRDFIAEVFSEETYEKNLYNYLTLRYELLAIVKFLRNILRLEENEDEVLKSKV